MRSTVRAVVVLLSLLVAVPVFASGMVLTATIAAEKAMAKLAEDIEALRKDKLESDKAAEIRNRLVGENGVSSAFVKAMQELQSEKQKLMVNKKENAAEIARIEQAEKRAEAVRPKLKKMISLMSDDKTMFGAVKSGALQRVAAEASAAMKDATSAISSANDSVTGGINNDDKPGTFEIGKIEVKSGKVRLWVTEPGGTEKEVFEGSKVRIQKLPIVLRASIQDTEKVRLEAQWGTGGATWAPKKDSTGPGRYYKYEGSNGSSSEWRAVEEYKWTATDNKERLRSIGQRNSDEHTKKQTGDIVELVPAKSVAQNVTLELTAKSLKWERTSVLPGGTRKADVVSKDNTATARIVISVFPAGTN